MKKASRKVWAQLWPGVALGILVGSTASTLVFQLRLISVVFGAIITLILAAILFAVIGRYQGRR